MITLGIYSFLNGCSYDWTYLHKIVYGQLMLHLCWVNWYSHKAMNNIMKLYALWIVKYHNVFYCQTIVAQRLPRHSLWRVPNFLYRLKCESKVKTTKKQKVETRSLICSTLGVEGSAKALGWGLGRMISI